MDNFFKFDNDDFILVDDDYVKAENKISPSHVLTSEEVLSGWDEQTTSAQPTTSPLEALKARMRTSSGTETAENKTEQKKEAAQSKPEEKTENQEPQSLLKKLKRYTVDEEGHDLSQNAEPLYELQSVADIIKIDGEKALKELSKKYDISIDDLGKSKTSPKPKKPADVEPPIQRPELTKPAPSPTPAFERMVSDSEARLEKEIFEELFPNQKVKHEEAEIRIPDISDTDNLEIGITSGRKDISDTATIRFTPIKLDGDESGIRVSSTTRVIDISEELAETAPEINNPKDTVLEKTEFQMFEPREEVQDINSAKRALRLLAFKKRNAFLQTFVSGLFIFLLSLFIITPLSEVIISNPRITMIVCGSFLSACTLANIDMLLDFKNLFKKRCSHDIFVSISSLLTISLSFVAASTEQSVFYLILISCIILFIRALCKFYVLSSKLGNLKQIAHTKPKIATSLISDSSTTFAMAKNFIEGDVLICAPQKTDFISDFMKYSDYGTKFSGKISIIFFVTLFMAATSATAAALYFGNAYHALYAASAITLLSAMPTLIFIDSLPLYFASKRLNRKGAMIAGKAGAMELELTNAAVVSSRDIFPEGYITLQDMKVLSDNNIDETILCAAALTTEMGSTLAPIFQKIAGTNDSYKMPTSSMIKYEEKLGISGWVNNKMLFIGNRTIMEGHGIDVPSIEVDRKILRSGYFPVYLAADGKACALLIIKYSIAPNVIKELHRVTRLGVTLLVENCDPNISEPMICDYFDLYEDSVKVMSNAGIHMYKSATAPTEKCSSPAAFRHSSITFISILNCASRIKQSNAWLSVLYALYAVFGALYFVYASFSGGSSLLAPLNLLLYELGATVLSLLVFLFKKP